MTQLTVVITTFNNADTLRSCLEAVRWADEILVLDSHSTDATREIAAEFTDRISQHHFLGYSQQKQMAIDLAAYDWVLLLDADEVVSSALQDEIRQLMQRGPTADGYTLPRSEQLFWRMNHPSCRMNHFLRLFDRRKGCMNDVPVHAAPVVEGLVEQLHNVFYHFGEKDIDTKVHKINWYSTGLVEDKLRRGKRANPWSCVFYPPLVFVKTFLLKKNYRSGWAGFIGSVCMAFYAFLKYAKLFEHEQQQQYGTSLLPAEAPNRSAALRKAA
ncbi:MAG: glycosyltransferase family 2 protein [Planctomycetaceae bacterium]|nr:glycosyltransferase family 2 protein [Planctomycetaceae bacterium]